MEAFTYINWETSDTWLACSHWLPILQEAGFFTWLAMKALKKLQSHPVALFIVFIFFAAVMAMFMDSITVMLFLSALTLQTLSLAKTGSHSMVIAEVCAADTGGAAALVGDPQTLFSAQPSIKFTDFITHTGPISAIITLFCWHVYLASRK